MKRRRNTKFKTITLKLSKRQMKSLKNYCKARKTTPIKLIKKNIKNYTESYAESVPEKFYASHKQLEMFAAEEGEPDFIKADIQS